MPTRTPPRDNKPPVGYCRMNVKPVRTEIVVIGVRERRMHALLLRLPGSVKRVFEERLREALPLSAEKPTQLHGARAVEGDKPSARVKRSTSARLSPRSGGRTAPTSGSSRSCAATR